MRRLLLCLLAASASAPALAQHAGHAPPPPPQQQQQQQDDPHAGHAMPQPPQPDPHADHRAEPPAEADPHAAHGIGHAPAAAPPPLGPPPPEALSGRDHAADGVYGAGAMAEAREELRRTHGDLRVHRFGIDQLELSLRGGADGLAWEDAHFWYGGDLDKLWLKSEGEVTFGEGLERAEAQALWSHAIGPWFDLQAGVRFDVGRGPERAHLVLGVQGLAPYWFEIDAAAFLSTEGDVTARVEAEYDQRITERLILQPRIEAELSLQDVPETRIGAGLSSAEMGLRLRYQIVPEFAPYVGVQYERAFGATARILRAGGDDPGGWSLLLGVRTWF